MPSMLRVCRECRKTMLTFYTFSESVYVVDLTGALKSSRSLSLEATFSFDVESVGENKG